MADSWGTPTPAITRVVQIEPGPIPTFTASAPASTRYLAASPVAILPTTQSICGYCFLTCFNTSTTPLECPCAVSTTSASAPASTKAATRSNVLKVTPTPAATRRRPFESLQAVGLSFARVISLYVISPTSLFWLSTTGSFSILCCCRMLAAASRSVDWSATIRFSFVITSSTERFISRSKRKSRFVTIPTRWSDSSTTGMPPILYSFIIPKASPTVLPLVIVTGS